MAALFTMPCYSRGITVVCVFFCSLIRNKWFNFNTADSRWPQCIIFVLPIFT